MSEINEKCLYVILLQESFLKSVELTSMLSRAYLIQTAVYVIDTSLEETTARTVKAPRNRGTASGRKERRI